MGTLIYSLTPETAQAQPKQVEASPGQFQPYEQDASLEQFIPVQAKQEEKRMAQMTALNYKIQEMAHRIRELREIENYTIAEMAMKTGVTEQEYIDCEMGRSDLNFAFLYRCALAFGVDVGDIIEGESPNLNSFTVTRRGMGQRIEEAHDMVYYNMASSFKNRIAAPQFCS